MEEATTRFEPLLSSSRHSALTPSSRFTRLEDPETLLQGFRADEQIHHFAARLQGPASTAFPEGLEGREPELTEAANINVVDRKSTRLNSSHVRISYAVFCLKKKK